MSGIPVEESKIEKILEAIRYSASSFGLQPYHILVVKDLETRKKLQAASFNQSQIVDCSHLLVFCYWDSINEEKINEFLADTASKRNMPIEAMNDYKNYLSQSILNRTKEEQNIWSAKQAYIALGTALAAAAELRVDSTPMEGFNSVEYDSILGLDKKGLKSAVIMAIGSRDVEGDWLAALPKVRRDSNKLFTSI